MATSKNPNGVPSVAEFGLLRAFLARQGFSQAWIDNTIGKTPSGQTRRQIADKQRAAMANLPKA